VLNHTTYLHKTATQWVTFVHGAGGSSTIWFKQIRSFRAQFNVLVLDLRGHGNSKPLLKDAFNKKYTFDSITNDIVEVINHLKIEKSHYVGISLGTILIRNLAEKHPDRVQSMIMGGAIMKLNFRSQVLMKLGVVFKSVVPYMLLYKFFAFVIMPRKNHKNSRLLINPLLRFFRAKDIKIPTLYVMGEEDHLFLPSIKSIVTKHIQSSLFVVKNCGHVVNVEQPDLFNNETIKFIKGLA